MTWKGSNLRSQLRTIGYISSTSAWLVVVGAFFFHGSSYGFSCDVENSDELYSETCTGEIDVILVSESISSDQQDKVFVLNLIGPFTDSESSIFSANLEVISPDATSSSNKDARDINSLLVSIDGEGSTLTINLSDADPMYDLATVSAQGGEGHKGQVNDAKGKRGGNGGSVNGDVAITIQDVDWTVNNGNALLVAAAYGGKGGKGGSGDSDGTASATGGDGGAGGTINGDVSVSLQDVSLTSSNALGGLIVIAQGGDAGNAGSADSVTGKANAGDGGTGGSVVGSAIISLESSSLELTLSEDAERSGIMILSRGGDGGEGERSYSFIGASAPPGDGGDGGMGGLAQLRLGASENVSNAAIQSDVEGLPAISIVSQGGNGGKGGKSLETAIGGLGGTGGLGGQVDLTVFDGSTLSAQTSADNTSAVYLGSLGGRGGDGARGGDGGRGRPGGDGGEITTSVASISLRTTGASSIALQAESVGGDGGDGGDNNIAITNSVGGDGGNGGNGGKIDARFQSVEIETVGDNSVGMLFASLGGTAGSRGSVGASPGDAGSGGEVVVDIDGGTVITVGDEAHAILARSAGGIGNFGGNGGRVQIASDAALDVSGADAAGIFAQSVAGSNNVTQNDDVVSGSGGDGGSGGNVTISNLGAIAVRGSSGYGIFAESASSFRSSSDGTNTQLAGDIFIETSGNIDVMGDNAYGIYASSMGYDASGSVEILVSGTINVAGEDSTGIYAETVTDGIESSMLVLVTEDDSIIASESALDAIRLSGGDENVVVNAGLIERLDDDDLSGFAVSTSGGSVTLENEGIINGSISLDSNGRENLNFATNTDDGTFNVGALLKVGDAGEAIGRFQNFGVLSPGGLDTFQTTTFEGGEFAQFEGGTYQIDLSMNLAAAAIEGTSDVVQASKADFDLDGTVAVNLAGSNLLTSSEIGSTEIMKVADGDLEIDGLEVADTAIVDYSLSTQIIDSEITVSGETYDRYSALVLSYSIDFAGGLDDLGYEDSVAFGNYWGGIVETARGPENEGSDRRMEIADISNYLMSIETREQLQIVYDSYIVDEVGAGVNSAIHSMLDLTDTLNSCPSLRSSSLASFLREQECAWIRGFGEYASRDESPTGSDYSEQTFGVTAAVQRQIGEALFLEVAGSTESVRLTGDNYQQIGSRFEAAAALKKEYWPLTVSGTVAGGYYALDYDRNYWIGSGASQASADVDGYYFAGEARLSYAFEQSVYYIKPIAALSVIQTQQNGFSEEGSGPINWTVDGVTETDAIARFLLEVGTGFEIGNTQARAYLRPGVTAFLTNPDISVGAKLANHSAGLLSSTFQEDRYFGELSAGLDVSLSPSVILSLEGSGSLSETSQSGGGSLEFRWVF